MEYYNKRVLRETKSKKLSKFIAVTLQQGSFLDRVWGVSLRNLPLLHCTCSPIVTFMSDSSHLVAASAKRLERVELTIENREYQAGKCFIVIEAQNDWREPFFLFLGSNKKRLLLSSSSKPTAKKRALTLLTFI